MNNFSKCCCKPVRCVWRGSAVFVSSGSVPPVSPTPAHTSTRARPKTWNLLISGSITSVWSSNPSTNPPIPTRSWRRRPSLAPPRTRWSPASRSRSWRRVCPLAGEWDPKSWCHSTLSPPNVSSQSTKAHRWLSHNTSTCLVLVMRYYINRVPFFHVVLCHNN